MQQMAMVLGAALAAVKAGAGTAGKEFESMDKQRKELKRMLDSATLKRCVISSCM